MEKPVIVITGASSGIGEATARLFASRGYRVVLAARRMDRLLELQQVIEKEGGEPLAIETDFSQVNQIQSMVELSIGAYGQIDILFNNAGLGRIDWLEKLDPISDITYLLQVNLLGAILATRLVLPYMIARRSGQIINMSSIGGYIAPPTYTLYAASKFGLRGFTDALRREMRVWGIQVSGVYPGGVATEFAKQAHINRKTGYTTPPWLRLTADQVALAIWDIVKKPRKALIMPKIMIVAVWLERMMPGFIDWIVERRFVRAERSL